MYLCVFRWIFKWSERENAASHSWQLYFLSPAVMKANLNMLPNVFTLYNISVKDHFDLIQRS